MNIKSLNEFNSDAMLVHGTVIVSVALTPIAGFCHSYRAIQM